MNDGASRTITRTNLARGLLVSALLCVGSRRENTRVSNFGRHLGWRNGGEWGARLSSIEKTWLKSVARWESMGSDGEYND